MMCTDKSLSQSNPTGRAAYDKRLPSALVEQMMAEFDKGSASSKLRNMLPFHETFLKCDAMRHILSSLRTEVKCKGQLAMGINEQETGRGDEN